MTRTPRSRGGCASPGDGPRLGLSRALGFALAALALLPLTPAAQEPARVQDTEVAPSLVTLRAVLERIEGKRAEVATHERDAAAATNEQQKLAILAELAAARTELGELQGTLDSVATGVDLEAEAVKDGSFDLVAEIEKLLRPLIEELKDITAEPRQLSQLKSDLQRETLRYEAMQRGLERVRKLRAATTDAAMGAALAAVEDRWRRRANDARGQQAVIQHRLDEKERERRSVYESTRSFVGGFFRERGLNLLVALGASLAVFLTLRALYRPVAGRVSASKQRRLTFRLAAVGYQVVVAVAAIAAALIVLYAAGDWILLGLALLFLAGIAWAGKQTLPRFVAEIRLLLNMGSMRESERVMFEGLPWRVDRIHLSVRLVNPALTGGLLLLPLNKFVGWHSRPCSEHETWFPSREGDWVAVGDVRGEVVLQTPESVQLAVAGGARVTYRTVEFLAANPTNLSAGFRVRTTFGIDYRHQAIATTTVPSLMQERLDRAMRQLVGDGEVALVRVEFQAASASSLDYLAFADLRGGAAPLHDAAIRTMQRTLVDLCNEQGWNIPFPQLTVHRVGV